jgi:REP element-mobilizing transposase RayT
MGYYERRLPHWHPDGAAIFATWRLHGSLPHSPSGWAELPAGKAFVAMDRELATVATGPSWLKDERVARAVADALRFGEEHLHLYRLHAWVIMSNHVHVLMEPDAEPPRITRSIKGFSARRANEILGRTGEPFWQDESFDHWVRDQKEFGRIMEYVECNPVAAGLVQRAEDRPWSSAYERREQERQARRPGT